MIEPLEGVLAGGFHFAGDLLNLSCQAKHLSLICDVGLTKKSRWKTGSTMPETCPGSRSPSDHLQTRRCMGPSRCNDMWRHYIWSRVSTETHSHCANCLFLLRMYSIHCSTGSAATRRLIRLDHWPESEREAARRICNGFARQDWAMGTRESMQGPLCQSKSAHRKPCRRTSL